MIEWSLLCEYLALIVFIIICTAFFQRGAPKTRKRKTFSRCLLVSISSIVVNVMTFYALKHFYALPLWVHYALNSAYFLLSVFMTLLITYYLECRIHDYFYNKRGLKIASFFLLVLAAIFILLIFVNVKTGCLFSFEGSEYVRGPLNSSGYWSLGLCVVMLVVSCIIHRKSISKTLKRIMIISPILALLLALFQVLYPDQLLNGMIAAVICLTIYLSFQSVSVESDSLTGLGNRLKCTNELTLRINGEQKYQIILVALRKFSQINHIYGHLCGDSLLFHVAKKLESLFPEARVFRFNSVEFLLLMPACASFVNDLRVDKVYEAMNQSWPIGEEQTKVSFCIVSLSDKTTRYSTEGVIERLDYTVELAKRKDEEIIYFDSDVSEQFEHEQALELYMKEALNMSAFEVWYQPIYYASSGKFDSCEALVRMRGADGKFISPDEFIPIAEENGMIDDITGIVIEQSCKLLSSKSEFAPKSISINLTIRQLLQADLVERLSNLIKKYNLEPNSLKIEITERTISENEETVIEVMHSIYDLGIPFLLDDFGTGYSNFATMLELPFECVKIDRSLVKGLPRRRNKNLLQNTLNPLFHRMERAVLVEGIETKEQLDAALETGVDRVQGFYFAKPMPTDELIEWYKANNPWDKGSEKPETKTSKKPVSPMSNGKPTKVVNAKKAEAKATEKVAEAVAIP